MAFVIIVVSVIAIIVVAQRVSSRGKESKLGHDRCAFCQSKLKETPDHMHYATTCKKCGKTQTWA